MIRILLAVIIVVLTWGCSGEGVVKIKGYREAVAFCENEYQTIVHRTDAHVWRNESASFVVNKGHLNDPEVAELVALAKVKCAKYR